MQGVWATRRRVNNIRQVRQHQHRKCHTGIRCRRTAHPLMLSLGDQLGRAGTGKSTPAENMSLTSDVRRWRLNTDCVRQDTRKPMKWLNVINGQISEVLATHRFASGQGLTQTQSGMCFCTTSTCRNSGLQHQTPIRAMKLWRENEPELFKKAVRNRAGFNRVGFDTSFNYYRMETCRLNQSLPTF